MIWAYKSRFVNRTPFQRPFHGHFLVSATYRQRVKKLMWLPTPIYKRMPLFWLVLGLLFIATGWYMGFQFTLTFGYVAIGIACCFFGIGIFLARRAPRQSQPATERTTSSTE